MIIGTFMAACGGHARRRLVALLSSGLVACASAPAQDEASDPSAMPTDVVKGDPAPTSPIAPASPITPATPASQSVSLVRVDPPSVPAGSNPQGLLVTVNGSGFVPGMKLLIGNTLFDASVQSATTLTATIPGDRLIAPGVITLAVTNGTPETRSNELTLTVSGGESTIMGLDPISTTVRRSNTGSFLLSVKGNNFDAASTVIFNGTEVVTAFRSVGVLEATVPSSLLRNAGQVNVVVRHGASISTPLVFTILAETPPTGVSCGGRGSCAAQGLKRDECTSGGFPAYRCGADGCLSLDASCGLF